MLFIINDSNESKLEMMEIVMHCNLKATRCRDSRSGL